jgi:subtilisin family serine protease
MIKILGSIVVCLMTLIIPIQVQSRTLQSSQNQYPSKIEKSKFPSQKERKKEEKFTLNHLFVKFKKTVTEKVKVKVRKFFKVKKTKKIKQLDVEFWEFARANNIEKLLETVRTFPEIEEAELNKLYKHQAYPNDSHFNKLWYLNNVGQNVNGRTGTQGADISALEAWDIETGNQDIVIAVIDSGVAYDHPDLINNIWTNNNEIAGNNVDDDDNGYVDDIHGWDFVNSDNNPSDYSVDLYGDGHGTHVAGIIAGQGNNGIGVSGVMWRASIMPLQIFDIFQISSFDAGVIQLISIIEAIAYAVDNGAKIINCSFGGSGYSSFMFDVINYAHQNGVLVVVAAGNYGSDNDISPFYPANYELPNILSVAATNELDQLAAYSNFGDQTVHVAAPGGSINANIFSTTPPSRELLFADNFESGGSQWNVGANYEFWTTYFDTSFLTNIAQDSVGNYANNEFSWIENVIPINATNCRGLHLQFDFFHSLQTGYDFFNVEVSLDKIYYVDLIEPKTGFSSEILTQYIWTNDLEAGEFYLRFSLTSDSLYTYDGVYLDNIILTGVPWVFNGNEYAFKSGTSMAAPVVSGILGLLWSYAPNLSHLEVKSTLLNTVDQLSSLSGKVVANGRVNAFNALQALVPPDSDAPLVGDINNDGIIDLTDAILTLKLMSNIEPPVPVFKEADINNDGKIGFEEAVNALQVEAGIRP